MTILLKKDGQLIIDADQPIEGVSLDNLAAILAGANDGDVIQYDATNGMWVSGAGGGSLPSVTSSDNGKVLGVVNAAWDTMAAPSSLPAVTASDDGDVLTVVSGSWAKATPSSGGGVMVVTDTDGTLNKTWQEIHDAMAVGQIPVVGYVDGNDAGITIIGWGALLEDAYSLWPVGANLSQDDPLYSASSASGYPTAN